MKLTEQPCRQQSGASLQILTGALADDQSGGWPVLLLTITGAKTGRTLVRPLCYSRDRERIVVIASRGGAPRNPPWYYNVVANPVVTVEVGIEKFRARAAQVYGSERARLFDAAAKLLPLFADYQKKTKREIPVLTLTRID
jgi:deazaflavin-dependent oxidoreductase (nitroreductase family)